jgi:peroxiredoxin
MPPCTRLRRLALLALAFPAQALLAEEEAGPELVPGHSSHGEAFNEGPRQAAVLLGNTGDVHFPISTSAPDAQAFFDQGIGQLHGFWYLEAERSFRQVLLLDPGHPMAYWGMAMANFENRLGEGRAKKLATEARDAAASGTHQISPREQAYIDGLASYLLDEPKAKDDKERRLRHLRSLEHIIHDYPDDIEALAFLAVRTWYFRRELPIASHEAVDSLIQRIFDRAPHHPAHHYRIHLWDYEKAERALASSALCGQSAPAIAHMWHMPGHIYSRVHRYEDAAWHQEASSRADHAHMRRFFLLPDQIFNYAHNQEWLVRSLVTLGQAGRARDLALNLVENPRHPKFNIPSKSNNSASHGRDRLFQLLERFELWQELAEHATSGALAPSSDAPPAEEERRRLRALGLAAFHLSRPEDLSLASSQLAALLEARRTEQETKAGEAREKARSEEKPEEEIAKAGEEAAKSLKGSIEGIEKITRELELYSLMLSDDLEAAAKLIDQCGIDDLPRSRLYLQLDQQERAVEAAQKAAEKNARDVLSQANLAHVLYAAGQHAKAGLTFASLRELAHSADLDCPPLQRLSPLVADLGLKPGEDWRQPFQPADDIGGRPNLDSLGPFRYSPPQAPDFAATLPDSSTVTLATATSRPTILIFFLGASCDHCLEQLDAFTQLHQAYADAGLQLIAIGTDPAAVNSQLVQDKAYPFPVASDESLISFRAYRAHDDFDQTPLHGTYLIDTTGALRWLDIGHQPFMDASFLLEEASRLLSLSPGPLATAP